MNSQISLLSAERKSQVPTFQQTVAVLGDVPALLYRALEFGTERNKTFFKELSSDERPRAHIRENIVRDQGKRFLERNNFQVEDDLISVGNEPLSALVLRFGLIQVRVLKGPGGIVPGCGDSMKRRRFYNQMSDLYLDQSGKIRETRMNLLCLWDFDAAFNLAGLFLAYPMRAGERASDVMTYWHEPLEHPAMKSACPENESKTHQEEERKQAEEELERLLDDHGHEGSEEIKTA